MGKNTKNFQSFSDLSDKKLEELNENWQKELDLHQSEVKKTTYDPTLSTVVSIALDVTSFNEKVEEYGVKYEVLLERTSEKAKAFLGVDEDTDYEVKGWMVDFCERVFEGIESLTTTYGINSTTDFAAVKYSASSASKAIKAIWEEEYEDDPIQMKYKKRREEEEIAYQKEIDLRQKNAINEHDRILKEYNEKAFEIQKLIDEESKAVIENLEKKKRESYDKIRNNYDSEIEELKKEFHNKNDEITRLQNDMASLGFFKMGAKKELAQKIESLTAEKQLIETRLKNKTDERDRKIRETDMQIENEKQKLILDIKRDHPLPPNPDKTIHRLFIATTQEVVEYKKFNWKKYGIDPNSQIDKSMSNNREFSLYIDETKEWYLTSEERNAFIDDFIAFNEKEGLSYNSDIDVYLSFFIETITHQGLLITYSLQNGSVENVIIPREEESSFDPDTYFKNNSHDGFSEIKYWLQEFGNLTDSEVQYIEDGYAC